MMVPFVGVIIRHVNIAIDKNRKPLGLLLEVLLGGGNVVRESVRVLDRDVGGLGGDGLFAEHGVLLSRVVTIAHVNIARKRKPP